MEDSSQPVAPGPINVKQERENSVVENFRDRIQEEQTNLYKWEHTLEDEKRKKREHHEQLDRVNEANRIAYNEEIDQLTVAHKTRMDQLLKAEAIINIQKEQARQNLEDVKRKSENKREEEKGKQ